MRRHRSAALGALAVAAAVALAACSGHSSAGGSGGASAAPRKPLPARSSGAGYDQGLMRVVDPSAAAGGTLTFDLIGSPDSLDYQDTDDPFGWDFARLYSMQLLTYRSCPGACGQQLVPDLATGLGQVSDHGLVWTYHLRADVRFQTGQLVTAADVKYGIERSYARAVLPYGPDYFQALLGDPGYGGPYAAPGSALTSVTTPDATTIQFHLLAPFPDFNYVVASPQSTPVPPSWDSAGHRGADFQLDPISTGPYEFQSYRPGKQLVMIRNPHWNPATDPQVRQLPGTIVVAMGLTPTAAGTSLLAGSADLELSGAGLQGAAAATVLSSPALRANADDSLTGLLDFGYLNLRVLPDVHCREAVEYAADKSALLTAYGGPSAAAIATAVLPPALAGQQGLDDYAALSMPAGDAAAAREQLRLCGQPHGFSTGLAYPSGSPQDALAAHALQASLAKVGIRVRLEVFPAGSYYTSFAGNPSYVQAHGLGIAIGRWRAAWPDGYAFLDELSDGDTIAYGGGNANIAQLNDPAINSLFARAARDSSPAASDGIWPQVDSKIMSLAAILPFVDQKALLYRNPGLTNVYADETYGMYNYAVLGVTQR